MSPQKSNIGSIVTAIFFIMIIVGSASFIWKSEAVQNWISNRLNTQEQNIDLLIPTPSPEDIQEASESSSAANTHMTIWTAGNYLPTEAQLEAAKNSIR